MSNNEKNNTCPFCQEIIKVNALKCKHCGSILVPMGENLRSHSQPNPQQTVQIVTNTSESLGKGNLNTYLGHGWAILILSVLAFFLAAVYIDDGEIDAADGVGILSGICIFPWFFWLLSQPSSNKVVPSIGIVILIFTILAIMGNHL